MKDKKFLKHIAIDEQKTDDGTIMGDRIGVALDEGFSNEATVHLYREDMMQHASEKDPTGVRGHPSVNWDWKVDPDAGLTMSVSHAHELLVALRECLAEAARQRDPLVQKLEAARLVKSTLAREIETAPKDQWPALIEKGKAAAREIEQLEDELFGNIPKRAAMVLVTHPHPNKGEFFLVVVEPGGDVLLPGGHVEGEETIAEAAQRELKEETALHVYLEDLVPIAHGKGIAEPDCVVTIFLARTVFGEEESVERGTSLAWTNWKELIRVSSFRAFYIEHFPKGFSHLKQTTWKE